ncbi:hypothetical protein [Actinomadura bangladeshensis]|uniref:Uncharacterized protein n=1 Tax=Actinomadura bangladeshensis TaxID=453573 RepID=A0A4R4P5C5_9ACTN|nr:hypothetical protein [Actinomadura bangladeshensis]TDC17139.1 hypothetical protein E1284_10345 [Actinomadura bangladeshensis]
MRCNAPLPVEGDATAHDPTAHDATAHDPAARDSASPGRDPFGEIPVPREPLPPPWAGQSPTPWQSPPDYTTPMPPSEERSIPLSPEPWAEPAIWQPPKPPGKSRLPYFLGAAGVVLLIGVALGIVFWPSGSNTPETPPAAVQPSTPSSQGTVPETGETGATEGTGDADAQAGAVNDLLDDMGGTRSDLGTVVEEGCTASGLQRILDERRGQLEKARALDVGALENGTQMKDALVRALEASTESNQRYLDVAPGCPSDDEVSDVNSRASNAKSEFIGYWTPIAEQVGLPSRTESDI